MNRALFARTLAANRVRMLACGLGLLVWGTILPVMYATFGKDVAALMGSNPLFEQFSRFGGGDDPASPSGGSAAAVPAALAFPSATL